MTEEGILGGTFFNQSTETTLSVEGSVDGQTQEWLLVRLKEPEEPAGE